MAFGLPAWCADIARLAIWLTVLAAVFVPLERLFAVHPHRVLRAGVAADLGLYFLNNLLPAALLGVPLGALAWAAHQVVPGPVTAALAGLPLWAAVPLAVVAGEFGYYWGHRACHRLPWLWRFHAVHHRAAELDFLVHTRAHPVDLLFGRFCGLVPVVVLGLGNPQDLQGSVVPVLATLFGTVWGFFIHANIRWRFGPLEQLIATPAFHHWHHTRSGPIDRNFSSTFPWLDRAFGTLHLPPEWPRDYGIAASTTPPRGAQRRRPLPTRDSGIGGRRAPASGSTIDRLLP